jgi:CubicO group peptidase (beta-lactamase class C family)
MEAVARLRSAAPFVVGAATLAVGAAVSAEPGAEGADAAIRAYVEREGIPAAHVTLLRGDTVVLQRGYGAVRPGGPPPDEQSIFPLGSISKQFTAALVLALADRGRLALDAPVGRYLPEWFADEPGLRVEHLLWQVSGLADFLWLEGYRKLADDPATPKSAYVALAAAAPRRFAPGTRWAYSNTNYKALALIAERTGGAPYDALLETHVLRPLGLTGIVPCHDLRPNEYVPGISQEGSPKPLDPSRSAYAGDGGLCGHAAALSVWLERAYVVREGRPAAMARLTQPARLSDGTLVPYGYGVSTRPFLGHEIVWHGGNVDSHSTMIAWLPQQDLRVVMLLARGFLWPTDLMAALVGAEPPRPVESAGASISGRFEDGLFRYEIEPDGAAMRVEVDLLGPMRFVPAGPREFVAEDRPATFRLRLPTDGTDDRFEFDWGEVRSYARRAGN